MCNHPNPFVMTTVFVFYGSLYSGFAMCVTFWSGCAERVDHSIQPTHLFICLPSLVFTNHPTPCTSLRIVSPSSGFAQHSSTAAFSALSPSHIAYAPQSVRTGSTLLTAAFSALSPPHTLLAAWKQSPSSPYPTPRNMICFSAVAAFRPISGDCVSFA